MVSRAALGLGSDSDDWRVRVVAVSLAPLEAAGVGLPPMHPLSRKDPPSAAPPRSKLRRVKVAAGSCAGFMMGTLL
jgi:hypothetical protein